MLIKPIKESDIPAVAKVHYESWKIAYKGILSDKLLEQLNAERFEKVWSDILKQKNRMNLLIEENKNTIGFIGFEITPKNKEHLDGEIIGLYVDPLTWRRGAGATLMEQAFIQMKKKGFDRAMLWTMTRNHISRNFFQKMGFKLTGEKRVSERAGEHFEEVQYIIVLPEEEL
jgi:N-acetylglutamate synthase-like GNAT family acetyltransferase